MPLSTLNQFLTEFGWQYDEGIDFGAPSMVDARQWGPADKSKLPSHTRRAWFALTIWRAYLTMKMPVYHKADGQKQEDSPRHPALPSPRSSEDLINAVTLIGPKRRTGPRYVVNKQEVNPNLTLPDNQSRTDTAQSSPISQMQPGSFEELDAAGIYPDAPFGAVNRSQAERQGREAFEVRLDSAPSCPYSAPCRAHTHSPTHTAHRTPRVPEQQFEGACAKLAVRESAVVEPAVSALQA